MKAKQVFAVRYIAGGYTGIAHVWARTEHEAINITLNLKYADAAEVVRKPLVRK